jgi:hypothetical protein
MELNRDALTALALFAATKKDVRFYIRGVQLEPLCDGRILGVACDTHVLASTIVGHYDLGGPTPPYLFIHRDDAAKLKRKRKVDPQFARVAKRAGKWLAAWEGQSVHLSESYVDKENGSYPDWRRIMPPDNTSGETGWFNPSLLVRFQQAGKLIGDYDSVEDVPVQVHHNGPNDGAWVSLPDYEDFYGVIMPMRPRGRAFTSPTWLYRSALAEPVPAVEEPATADEFADLV